MKNKNFYYKKLINIILRLKKENLKENKDLKRISKLERRKEYLNELSLACDF